MLSFYDRMSIVMKQMEVIIHYFITHLFSWIMNKKNGKEESLFDFLFPL